MLSIINHHTLFLTRRKLTNKHTHSLIHSLTNTRTHSLTHAHTHPHSLILHSSFFPLLVTLSWFKKTDSFYTYSCPPPLTPTFAHTHTNTHTLHTHTHVVQERGERWSDWKYVVALNWTETRAGENRITHFETKLIRGTVEKFLTSLKVRIDYLSPKRLQMRIHISLSRSYTLLKQFLKWEWCAIYAQPLNLWYIDA